LNAAVSLRPTLATVWLGSNDVLKYAFSAGKFTGVNGINGNTAQVQTDMTTIITSLQKTGAKVIVANIVDVLSAPFFVSVAPATPGSPQCAVQTFLTCLLVQTGVPAANAGAITTQIAAAYNLTPAASGSNPAINGGYGYVTIGGAIMILQALAKAQTPNLDPNGPGTGNGPNYTTPGLAASIQSLNNTVNAGIAAATTATQTPLVDVHAFNADVATGCASGCANDPLALLALSGTISVTGKCCTLAFGGGLVSFDGLHPSNTGYAFITEAFIQAANKAYGAGIPDISPKAVHDGTGAIPYPDPYAQP
jgi:lysophospholipase L1-like esterase